jgi:hypothetical protein
MSNYENTFAVTYSRATYNPFRSYPQNYNRYRATRIVVGLEAAKEFAATVPNATIRNSAGYKVN